jgi:transcriptional repressor NrdR
MRCPKCECIEDKVIDSRSSKEGAIIRRRRECAQCTHRFTTYEQIEHQRLMVVKRDGRREEFARDKLLSGISKACQKRPISQQVIENLTQGIYDSISEEYSEEVPSMAIGEAVMNGLREIDQVAYVRYASVYRRFEEADDFVQAVKKLETKHDSATYRLPGF